MGKINSRNKYLFPKTIYILLGSMLIYYWNVFFEDNGLYERILVIVACLSILFFYCFSVKRNIYKRVEKVKLNYRIIKKVGYIYLLIGLIAHAIFYVPNLKYIVNYGDSYTIGRGNGYITVFFDFYIVGILLLMEYYKKKKKYNIIVFIIFPYIIFYLFVLMKRRQLILLALGMVIILFNDYLLKKKKWMYLSAIFAYIVLSIFGKARGAFDVYGFVGGIDYIKHNFNLEWISLSNFEGKYMSMILSDVVLFVKRCGLDIKVILGAIMVFIPRKLFGFKLLAFPEWYTNNFHPDLYAIGTGYAGSLVAEAYLIGHIPFIVILFALLGVLCRLADGLLLRGYNGLYVISVYIMIMIPRLDLGSIFIMIVFMFIPTAIGYKVAVSKPHETA